MYQLLDATLLKLAGSMAAVENPLIPIVFLPRIPDQV